MGAGLSSFICVQFIKGALTDGREERGVSKDKPASLCKLNWNEEVTRVCNVGGKIVSPVQDKFCGSILILLTLLFAILSSDYPHFFHTPVDKLI